MTNAMLGLVGWMAIAGGLVGGTLRGFTAIMYTLLLRRSGHDLSVLGGASQVRKERKSAFFGALGLFALMFAGVFIVGLAEWRD